MGEATAFRIGGRTAVIVVLGAIVQVASTVPIPFLVRDIFGDILDDSSAGTSRVALLGGLIVVLQLASGGASVLLRRAVAVSTSKYGASLRQAVQEMLLTRDVRALQSVDDARLLHHAVTLPTRAEDGAYVLVSTALPAAFVAVVTTIVLFVIEWRMALVLVVAVPVLSLTQRLSRTRVRRSSRARSEAEAELSRMTLSTIGRTESVRTEPAARDERDRHHVFNEQLRQTHQSLASDRALVVTSNLTAVVLAVTVLLLVGAWMISLGTLTVSEFLAFYAGVAILRGPAQQLGGATPAIDAARDARALLIQLDEQLGPVAPNGDHHPTLERAIEVRGARFSHGDRVIIDGLDLTIERGTFVALVGPNGAGKTTLVRLLLGLYTPEAGQLSADGVPYRELDLAALRLQIGVSFQQAELAEATIRDNIGYGRELSAADMAEAIELTGLQAVIDDLPDGLDTMIGPGGRRLSKGQEQRIALARAVVGRPAVLMLDEPTNHLDPDTVETLLGRLVDQPHQPAILVVSHDRRALARADRVVELRDGRIASP